MEKENFQYKNIPGWNTDADRENEPTYPMKQYTGDDHLRSNWERPELQKVSVEVLKSNERPSLSAVVGTPQPPSGLSGRLRRKAFTYSESEYGHWLNLLLADRINMAEGLLDDLKHGYIPNILAEKGFRAEWKYNAKNVVKKVIVATAVTAFVIAILSRKKESEN